MADTPINNPIDIPPPALEATTSQYSSRIAEIAANLEGLIRQIEQTTQDIDAVLAQ